MPLTARGQAVLGNDLWVLGRQLPLLPLLTKLAICLTAIGMQSVECTVRVLLHTCHTELAFSSWLGKCQSILEVLLLISCS